METLKITLADSGKAALFHDACVLRKWKPSRRGSVVKIEIRAFQIETVKRLARSYDMVSLAS